MTLQIIIDNVDCKLTEQPPDDIVEKIRNKLKYKNDADNPFMRKKFGAKAKYAIAEYKYLYNKKTRKFPTGLLSLVEKIFKTSKIKYSLKDTRAETPIINPIPLTSYVLRDYQQYAKKQALAEKNCQIKISTGGGKTAIMVSICADLNQYKRLILVRRQMLFDQTVAVFERELGHKVGRIGCGEVDIQDVTIAMIPTLARALDPKWKFKKGDAEDEDDKTKLSIEQKQLIEKFTAEVNCLIIDEGHCLGSDTAQLVCNKAVGARYRILMSATPWRDDGKDILLEAVTGKKVVDINGSYLIEKGYLVPPHIYFFKTPPVPVHFSRQGKYPDVYKEFIVENNSRNDLIIQKAIQGYNRFEKILILVKQISHGKILLEMLEKEGVWVDYLSGKDSAVKRAEIMDNFSSRTRSVIIGSDGIMSEGIDLPAISVIINTSAGRSSVQFYQKVGRALRLATDKNKAVIIDFLDQNIRYMNNQSKARIKIMKTEPLYQLRIEK